VIDPGDIFLGHKLKPPLNAGMFERFDIFLRAVKAKIVVELGGRTDLFSRLPNPKLAVGYRYHHYYYVADEAPECDFTAPGGANPMAEGSAVA